MNHNKETCQVKGCGNCDTTVRDILSKSSPSLPQEVEESEWKDSYRGKLWSTAVQKCFEAPFVEVAIQHLLFTIDKKYQEALARQKEEMVERIGVLSFRDSSKNTASRLHAAGYNEGIEDAIDLLTNK